MSIAAGSFVAVAEARRDYTFDELCAKMVGTNQSHEVRGGLFIPAERIARDVAVATGLLSRRSGVKRVWLFGSAAKGQDLDWRSDLDFAVEGLPVEDLEGTWSELYSRLDLPLDLVRWESASTALKEEVCRWGKVLYEA